jgi:uncharacterized DUF497 family protein
MLVRWTWDVAKERANRAKHGVGFAAAARVLRDPAQASRLDPFAMEERWQTIGKPGSGVSVHLFVVHTYPGIRPDGTREGRIISARFASKRELRQYEEGEF